MLRTLKGKISLVNFCLVIMIAVVGAASIINLYRLSRTINGLMSDNYKSIHAAGNMIEAIERQDSAILLYMYSDRQKSLELFSENHTSFLRWYDVVSNNITERGEKELVANLYDSYKKYTESFSRLQEIMNSQGVEKSENFYHSTILPAFENVKSELKELSLINENSMFYGKDHATEISKDYTYVITLLTFFALVGGFIASRFFVNRFLEPIYSLTETMKLVKEGDLNQQTRIISQDEIGTLAHEFNNMTKRLLQYEQSTLGKLLEEKNKTLAIVKSIADPLIVLDNNYRILLLNNACEKIFNISEREVINRHFLEVIKNEELFDFISSIFEGKGEKNEKIILVNDEQEEYYFNVIATAIKDKDTKLTGLIVVFHNVTQLKRLDKMRTDFIGTISHEFKTPLTSIIMGTDLILNEKIGTLSKDQREIMEVLKEDGDRLSSLVNNLLELTRLESGKTLYKIQPCHVEGIIDNSIRQFSHISEQKGVHLYNRCEKQMPKVKADYEKITWVLNNLISNALRYTSAGDEILVNASVRGAKMYVIVKDTGAGIPHEYLDKIFDKFVQVKDGELEVRGTGLGLAVVKEIIMAHGGTIWCESKLDTGSSFIFTLDLVDGRNLV